MGTIAWVEDAERYVRQMIDQLRELGHEVEVFEDCNSFLEKANAIAEESDVVILDLWLPVGEGGKVPRSLYGDLKNTERGIWLFQQIRGTIQRLQSKAKVVILSGNLDVDTLRRLKNLGMQKPYLSKKPVAFGPFIEFVDRLARRKELPDDPPEETGA